MCIPHLVESVLCLMAKLGPEVGRIRQIGVEIVVLIDVANGLNIERAALKAAQFTQYGHIVTGHTFRMRAQFFRELMLQFVHKM